ncbi:MAG: Na/Pi cotransporter family protein [Kiritimatiellaeota bacterium]|nr:Na/Pi cotransporter family protein [Kiritimatiellota bacterium]
MEIIIKIVGGLGLFLLGMSHLSEGLQTVAGQRLRKLVAAVTNNRFAGAATGTVVTGIVQSSSVVTVMTVGLVSAGIMTLNQSINVIIGANIGTTATAWIVALVGKVGNIGLPIVAVAALFFLFVKNERVRYTFLSILGFGLIFYGLQLMNEGLGPLKKNEAFIAWFQLFHATSVWGVVKCVLAGTVLTAVIQSSSAATAISIQLAVNGVITFETATALVFGMNIGTTVTAWLASLAATTEARRAALAHTLFNILGVVIFVPFFLRFIMPAFHSFYPLMGQVEPATGNYPGMANPIAMFHTFFNVGAALLFLPFVNQFARLVRLVVPGKRDTRERPRLAVLNIKAISPVFAAEQARREVENMADVTADMLGRFRPFVSGEAVADGVEKSLFQSEEDLDTLQHEVSHFLGTVMSTHLSLDVARRARMLLRVADEYESVSDEVVALLKTLLRMKKHEFAMPEKSRAELVALHDKCAAFHASATAAFKAGKQQAPDVLAHIRSDSTGITAYIKSIRNEQMKRLSEPSAENPVDPLAIVAVMDMLNIYRRLKEDCLNIGESMLDENAG